MSTENWAEERQRLQALLADLESGKITRFGAGGSGGLKAPTTAERIASIRRRLAALDDRLDSSE